MNLHDAWDEWVHLHWYETPAGIGMAYRRGIACIDCSILDIQHSSADDRTDFSTQSNPIDPINAPP